MRRPSTTWVVLVWHAFACGAQGSAGAGMHMHAVPKYNTGAGMHMHAAPKYNTGSAGAGMHACVRDREVRGG